MALFGSGSSGASNQEVKATVVKQLQQEAAMVNARNLIGKINEHCYDACIPNPGSSLSSGEQTCLSNCMDKYITFWNAVSKTYVGRVSLESKKLGGENTIAMNSLATKPSSA